MSAARRIGWLLGAAAVVVGLHTAFGIARRLMPGTGGPGCARYVVAKTRFLVAHAGGATPQRTYPNSVAAMDASYRRGHRLFEIDLRKVAFLPLRPGHERGDVIWPGSPEIEPFLRWLAAHRDAYIVTDIKSDNVTGLTELATKAGALRHRIIPQIYQPGEFARIAHLGFHRPILTLYRNRDPDWAAFANRADIMAVALRVDKVRDGRALRKPIYAYTADTPELPAGAAGMYTDCLVPPAGTTAAPL